VYPDIIDFFITDITEAIFIGYKPNIVPTINQCFREFVDMGGNSTYFGQIIRREH
jgi:hypothetical protein